ncbi:MAG TPA: UDP-N-acetylmuramoyl-tripeptide--D-alanyl-D-alanine ligase [Caulobacteraceae bacterium]|jgi:UDP-N-acetylmuramoyl-tripeptide--D-alanyl-D-alanine ligase|nr:UDP-N-acetylmuramoyl-tripeptide--D-alanyl-D-alanine ligase [Caulobacteraceae bacterium]
MAEPLWSTDEIVTATGGHLHGAPFKATGVSIDTRTLEPGDLFVALGGVRDGHEFVGAAMNAGASGVLASRPVDAPSVLAGDTLQALEKLGEAARIRARRARRGAVTGSVGKTSVTQAIRAGLARAGRAHASVKSYNNHIGVPLTLARMPRDTERAVFEIGMNHAGEITPLTQMVQPHAVLVTTVAQAHIENFADGEAGVARAKAEIFDGLTPGGVAVLNADNRWFDYLSAAAKARGAEIRSFGSDPACTAQLTGFSLEGASGRVEAKLRGRPLSFTLRQSGHHWGLMSLAALLMMQALDVPHEPGVEALATFEPLEGRGAERQVAMVGGPFTLIDESYNANPVSVAAALRTLGLRRTAGRRIAALTDMLELGPDSAAYHAGLAREIEAADVDLVFCAGPMMKSLWRALPPTRQGAYADTAEALAPLLARAIEPGDLVVVKGSRDSKAKALFEALSRLDSGSGDAG